MFRQSITHGVDITTKKVTVNGSGSRILTLIDVAGEESFAAGRAGVFEDVAVVVVVYNMCDVDSFDSVSYWLNQVNLRVSSYRLFLVANKSDLSQRMVSTRDGQDKAEALKAVYLEVSATIHSDVEKLVAAVFREITKDEKFVPVGRSDIDEIVVHVDARQDQKGETGRVVRPQKKACCIIT